MAQAHACVDRLEHQPIPANVRNMRLLKLLAVVACLASVMVNPTAATAQETATDEVTRRWIVGRAPHIDLWYHGIAVIGYEGFGVLPLYDPDYADRVAAARAERGNPGSALVANAAALRRAFSRDSIFEVFHFLPMYFASSSPEGMFEALRAVANSTGTPVVSDPSARFGASATAYVLQDPDQRRVLGEFVDALEDEWNTFYSSYSRELVAEESERAGQFQQRWDDVFQPALRPFLTGSRLDGGIILVSPALGAEGRIFQGDPGNPVDNVVAVGFLDGGTPDAELYAVVRELCFPVVRRAIEVVGVSGDRVAAERSSSRAAVRCGALILEQYLPSAADGYRRSFTGIRDGDAAIVTRAFTEAYPLAPALEQALEEAVTSLPPP